MAQRVLLTGSNGFVGSHVLEALLGKGFLVQAIVRSQTKAQQVQADFPGRDAQLQFGIVPDITAPNAFDEVVKASQSDFVIHTASPFLYRVVSSNRDFLDPAIKGTLELLKSVKAHGPSVQRVVITSSIAAVVNFSPAATADPVKKIYTEDDWNPITWDEALAGSPNAGYQASKKFAEKSAWDFMTTEKPSFDLVTLTPPMVYGPIRHTIKNLSALNESNTRIYKLFVDSKRDAELPPNGMHVYTDVRDLAAAHVQAILVAEASGQRFIVCAGQVSSQQISDVVRSTIPAQELRTPRGTPGGNPLPDNAYNCDSEKARNVLGVSFRSREETFVDLTKQLLEIEAKEV